MNIWNKQCADKVQREHNAMRLYSELSKIDFTKYGYRTEDKGDDIYIIQQSIGGWWKQRYLIDKRRHCAYEIMDSGMNFVHFTADDIDWDSLKNLSDRVKMRARNLSVIYPTFVGSFQYDVAEVSWQLNPDGRYFMDSDGYGMTDDEEVTLYGFIDREMNVLVKFQFIENGSRDLNRLRREAEAKKGIATSKICFPHPIRGDFESLQDAYDMLHRRAFGWNDNTLFEIVRCNTRFRNHFRKYGSYALMAMILQDECLLTMNKASMTHLLKAAIHWPIAPYDIQCYNVCDRITVLGHTFNGLEDINRHVEIVCSKQSETLRCTPIKDALQGGDVHVGKFYEPYPRYDNSNCGEKYCFVNYIFRTEPITETDMVNAYKSIRCGSNFCMVSEEIPTELLPLLYCNGGNYMFYASWNDARGLFDAVEEQQDTADDIKKKNMFTASK